MALYNLAVFCLWRTTPESMCFCIVSPEKPNSLRISTVCCPSLGASKTLSTPGVRDNLGAGPGSNPPSVLWRNDLFVTLWGWRGASPGSKTGVQQASVSLNISVHSSWVLEANTLVNFCLSLLESVTFWGYSSRLSPSPETTR